MILVIFGPPAVGKGTQAARLSAKYAIPHLSTGAMLRAAAAEGTRLGRKAKKVMDRGGLVPDSLVMSVLKARLDAGDCTPGFILDGVPRTLGQAKTLDRMLRGKKRRIDGVIVLEAGEAELLKRVAKRAAETRARGEPVRSDDTAEVFQKRMREYRAQTAPVLPYYDRQGKVARIDAMGEADAVAEAMFEAIAALMQPKTWYQRLIERIFGKPAVRR